MIERTKIYKVLFSIKHTHVEDRLFPELVEEFGREEKEEVVKGMRGKTIILKELFRMCPEGTHQRIGRVLEKFNQKTQMKEKIEGIEKKWKNLELPLIPDAVNVEVVKAELEGREKESEDDSQGEKKKEKDKEKRKRKGKKKSSKSKNKEENIISFPKVRCLLLHNLLSSAEEDVEILMNQLKIDYSFDWQEQLLRAISFVSSVLEFLEALERVDMGNRRLQGGIDDDIVMRNTPGTRRLMRRMENLAIKVREMKTLGDERIGEMKEECLKVEEEASFIFNRAPDEMMTIIPAPFPRFLVLTASELITYATFFSAGERRIDLSRAILGRFVPGGRGVRYGGGGEGGGRGIKEIVGYEGEELRYGEMLELRENIWSLPELMFSSTPILLQEQADSAMKSLSSSSSFFEWFASLVVKFDTPSNYPFQMQILNFTISSWFSSSSKRMEDFLLFFLFFFLSFFFFFPFFSLWRQNRWSC
jgi:hypothetical protein